MNIIIIGAGKVGFTLAEMLSYENNNVVLIEKNPERQKIIEENLDVQTILGSGTNIQVLEEAGVSNSDLLIAVTEIDEVNMVSCFIAKKYNIPKTVARLRSPEYIDNPKITTGNSIGIDLVISPEMVSAQMIKKIIDVPEAINVDYYADGRLQLLEIRINEDSPITNKSLEEISFPKPNLIAAIIRKESMIIPRGKDIIKPGDLIFVIAQTKHMLEVEEVLGEKRTKVKNIIILGGGRIGYALAKMLDTKSISIKIIDSNIDTCKKLSDELNNVLVLHGDGTDVDLLEEEEAGNADMVICVSDDDKVNILVSLLAKHLGANKTVAKIKSTAYVSLVEKVGIDVVVNPRLLTAGAIFQFIRKGDIVSVTLLGSAKAEMIELIVSDKVKITNIPLKKLNFPKDAIIGSIIRNDKVIVPSGDDYLLPGDKILIFALPKAIKKIENIFFPKS